MELKKSELLILLAISNSKEPGVYGLDIQRAIAECSNETISIGSLYANLTRLRSGGYITSTEGAAIAGGAKRQYYRLTPKAEASVSYLLDLFSRLSNWTSDHDSTN